MYVTYNPAVKLIACEIAEIITSELTDNTQEGLGRIDKWSHTPDGGSITITHKVTNLDFIIGKLGTYFGVDWAILGPKLPRYVDNPFIHQSHGINFVVGVLDDKTLIVWVYML